MRLRLRARKRDKTVFCTTCNSKCTITANLDSGRVELAIMPTTCVSPAKCLDNFAEGIFARQFGAQVAGPKDF